MPVDDERLADGRSYAYEDRCPGFWGYLSSRGMLDHVDRIFCCFGSLESMGCNAQIAVANIDQAFLVAVRRFICS